MDQTRFTVAQSSHEVIDKLYPWHNASPQFTLTLNVKVGEDRFLPLDIYVGTASATPEKIADGTQRVTVFASVEPLSQDRFEIEFTFNPDPDLTKAHPEVRVSPVMGELLRRSHQQKDREAVEALLRTHGLEP